MEVEKGPEIPEHSLRMIEANTEKEDQKIYFTEALKAQDQLIKIFKLLQLFCEGHNHDLQLYLRKQEQQGYVSGKTINFIKDTSQLFGSYYKFANVYSVELGEQLIDFLIESLQGPCKENQEDLADNKIVEFVEKFLLIFQNQNDYRNKGFFNIDDQGSINQGSINELMIQSIELLACLLEANDDANIYKHLVKLDIRYLRVKLLQEYITYVTEELGLDEKA